jgi:hypothetical protein
MRRNRGRVHAGMRHMLLLRHWRPHGRPPGARMPWSCGEPQRAPGVVTQAAGMEGRGPAAPRAAQSLGGAAAVVLHAPAAGWWARPRVASIKRCRVSWYASPGQSAQS